MNIQAMMKQAQKLQSDMMSAKKEIDEMDFDVENQFVKVSMDGTKKLKKLEISRDLDLNEEEDMEMLEDMILVAVNDVIAKIDETTEEKMGKFNNSMPGLF